MRPVTVSTGSSPERVTVDWAESGIVALTGHADGSVVAPPGRGATRARELSSWMATCAGVDVDGARLLGERAAFDGLRRRGAVSAGGACRLLRSADGWVAVSCARPDDPPLLGAMIGDDLDAGDPWPAVAEWVRVHDGRELAERAELLGIAAWPVSSERATAPEVPISLPRSVEGLLVVDFSALWAGPLCAHLLGLAGARVVKVETPQRPDGARLGNPAFYALLHHGHESVVLDPRDTADRRAIAALVDAADIVIEASRPRALAGFGLDAEAAAARGTTWISITAAGRASNRIGFGDDIAAAAGLIAHDETGAPLFVGDAIADPLTGLTAAALAMSRTSGGMLWDISMTEVVARTLTPEPAPLVRRHGDSWSLDTAIGPIPVAAPTARTPAGSAPESGADTEHVLRSLRIPVP
ncbi:CoA transferase [Nocardia bovistercoris]|uniref:CoA transferase n=1 Tax=Nocardia bovistercoris TaxID=2785916 RepID=A0A931N3P8_9NOCA|nr:CoA transferase [Nocardia bovistercoris]MBH0778054.1 CoA transferase [Nocardia bovistercoris]